MVVQHINNDLDFEQSLNNAGPNRLVICDFFAHWCGPCRAVAPLFEQLSDRYRQAMFLKVDVDQCRATCQQHSVRAMPTFVALLNRSEVGRVQGADPHGLERLVVDGLALLQGGSKGQTGTSAAGEHVANTNERQWLAQFVNAAERMSIYEDELSQTLALSLIPSEELRQKATVDGEVNDYELARQLLNWFHSFFQWVNVPKCSECQVEGKSVGNGVPTEEEAQDEASRVELFKCEKCGCELRFPRYNNPAKLLETKKGRCGEYANCFALCCRAMGFQTRWVTDNLDHVWVEVWSGQLKRWLHCDPCENVLDTPLMYDKGWGKKHAYVLAFAIDHMQDVTWRYHFNHRAAIKRRTAVREPVLRNFINKMNSRLARTLAEEHRLKLQEQMLSELVELLTARPQLRDGTEAENQGRRSGAEDWRRARGELGKEEQQKKKCADGVENK